MVYGLWEFDVRGYWDVGTITHSNPENYDAGENQLLQTYLYFRDIIKFNRKPRLLLNELNTPANFIDDLNIYHFAVANMVAVAAAYKMGLYNECFQNMNTYLPDKMVRLQRLWARVNAIVRPDFIKRWSIMDGVVASGGPGFMAPHIRFWSHNNLGLYGPIGDYDEATLDNGWSAAGIYDIMAAASEIDSMLDDLQSAVEVLEGKTGNGVPNDEQDLLALKEMYEYIATVENFAPAFSQSLPNLMAIPPITNNKQMLNDWYCRGISFTDTKGVGGDEIGFFPVENQSDLGERVPIKGWGTMTEDEFDLRGAIKFYACVGNAVDGTNTDATVGAAYRQMGTSRLYEASNGKPYQVFQTYTREDADEIVECYTTDFGDGADIRAFRNTEHPLNRHIYGGVRYLAQLGATQEYHFVDERPVDYEMWAEPKNYGEEYANRLARLTGTPYLV
jgi:hypothetical protein